MMQVYDRLEEAAKRPYYTSRDTKEIEQIRNSIPRYYKLTGVLVPNITATLFKRATLDAIYDTGRIGIACKIYKNLKGHFPDKLTELSPDILKKIPVDPFTGDPFIYKKQDSGFIVYSIGNNLKDEEGKGTWQIVSFVMEKDDWAWKEKVLKN